MNESDCGPPVDPWNLVEDSLNTSRHVKRGEFIESVKTSYDKAVKRRDQPWIRELQRACIEMALSEEDAYTNFPNPFGRDYRPAPMSYNQNMNNFNNKNHMKREIQTDGPPRDNVRDIPPPVSPLCVSSLPSSTHKSLPDHNSGVVKRTPGQAPLSQTPLPIQIQPVNQNFVPTVPMASNIQPAAAQGVVVAAPRQVPVWGSGIQNMTPSAIQQSLTVGLPLRLAEREVNYTDKIDQRMDYPDRRGTFDEPYRREPNHGPDKGQTFDENIRRGEFRGPDWRDTFDGPGRRATFDEPRFPVRDVGEFSPTQPLQRPICSTRFIPQPGTSLDRFNGDEGSPDTDGRLYRSPSQESFYRWESRSPTPDSGGSYYMDDNCPDRDQRWFDNDAHGPGIAPYRANSYSPIPRNRDNMGDWTSRSPSRERQYYSDEEDRPGFIDDGPDDYLPMPDNNERFYHNDDDERFYGPEFGDDIDQIYNDVYGSPQRELDFYVVDPPSGLPPSQGGRNRPRSNDRKIKRSSGKEKRQNSSGNRRSSDRKESSGHRRSSDRKECSGHGHSSYRKESSGHRRRADRKESSGHCRSSDKRDSQSQQSRSSRHRSERHNKTDRSRNNDDGHRSSSNKSRRSRNRERRNNKMSSQKSQRPKETHPKSKNDKQSSGKTGASDNASKGRKRKTEDVKDTKEKEAKKPRDDEKAEKSYIQTQSETSCFFKGCGACSVVHLRKHLLKVHIPALFHDNETLRELENTQFLSLRKHALEMMSRFICGASANVGDLVRYINSDAYFIKERFLPYREMAMRALAKQAGWNIPYRFCISPVNSPAALIHWRAFSFLMSRLTPEQSKEMFSLFGQKWGIPNNTTKPRNRPNPVKRQLKKNENVHSRDSLIPWEPGKQMGTDNIDYEDWCP